MSPDSVLEFDGIAVVPWLPRGALLTKTLFEEPLAEMFDTP
jgi:hypothetical protein